MLKEWSLGNFKSIAETQKLNFAPLTLFVGANSSGKSSVLQSILLLSQTLRARGSQQPILLNGEYTHLGYISDVLHDGWASFPMQIGLILQPGQFNNNNEVLTESYDLPIKLTLNFQMVEKTPPEVILYELDLNQGDNRIRLERTVPKKHTLLDLHLYPGIQVTPELKTEILNGNYDYTVKGLRFTEGRYLSHIAPFELHCSLDHFLPNQILETLNATRHAIIVAIQTAAEYLRYKIPPKKRNGIDDPKDIVRFNDYLISRQPIGIIALIEKQFSNIKKEIEEALGSNFPVGRNYDPRIGGSFQNYVRIAEMLLQNSRSLSEWVDRVKNEVAWPHTRAFGDRLVYRAGLLDQQRRAEDDNTSLSDIGIRSVSMPPSIATTTSQIIDYFSNRIYYLGPLREDPRFIYSLPPYPEVMHVGLKGEFTASILERFKNYPINYPVPPGKGKNLFETAQAPLIAALSQWLDYMGLLAGITTKDRGKIGTELAVHSAGVSRELDLTSIGVGVSQILPTLVAGLIAPPGTTFLLEQPELHLHPKVQSNIGDFLLGLTKVGKQSIVETHSEYIVNRVRRRAAEEASPDLVNNTQIFFAERSSGKSNFRPLILNEFGSILDWPEGFFDEGPNESQLIMQASMQKRRVQAVSKP